MDYQEYINANKKAWNLRAPSHFQSSFYNLDAWKKEGGCSLTPIELSELTFPVGTTLLHLQCHFGQDTLSLARKGAIVTGSDFSDVAIERANQLAQEVGIPSAQFICCNLYDLKQHLQGSFDVVFTSYGTIGWLPDLQPWADIIAHYLKPGGFFYMADFHPALWMLDDKMEALTYSYFNVEVIETQQSGTYADREAPIQYSEYGWNHSMSDLLNSLLKAGLQLEFFNEYPYSPYDCFANTVRGEDGFFRIKNLENKLPMVYSLKMSKPL